MPVTCAQAAKELDVSPSQVRRWIQSGAPVARDGRPMLVEVADLQRWRQGQAGDLLCAVGIALLRTVRSELTEGRSAPKLLNIEERRAAALLLAAYSRIQSEVAGPDTDAPVHEAIAQLRRIAGANV